MDSIVKRVTDTFGRLHVLVVGPGLSRDDAMQNSAREIMLKAREQNMAIVVDAVCWILQQDVISLLAHTTHVGWPIFGAESS